MPVDTSVYQNQPNPLGQLTGVFGVMNAAQQNQLLQTANQQHQLALHQGYANDLLNYIAPLVNNPDITQAQIKATAADRARSIGAAGAPAYNIIAQQLNDPNWRENLKTMATSATGPQNILSRQPQVGPNGEIVAPPSQQYIGKNVQQTLPLTAQPSIEKMQKDLTDVGNFQEQIAPLMQMHKEINSLPEGSTGPLTTGILHTVEGIHSIAPGLLKYLPGVSPEQMASRAAYAKYAAQAANNINGRGTDLSLMQTITGNPNPSINDLTDKQLGMFAIGVMRMGAAKTLEASRAGPNAEIGTNGPSYINSKAGIASKLNPAAFMYDLLSPEERKKLASMPKGKERDNFNYSIHIGQRNQIMNLPGQ
jgi:hypothetical protein